MNWTARTPPNEPFDRYDTPENAGLAEAELLYIDKDWRVLS